MGVIQMPQPRKATPEKYCANCGVPLVRKDYNGRLEDVGAFLRRKYCSLTCANSKKRPSHWETYHWRARKHRKDYCEACGWTLSLEVHHADQQPENNETDNLQTLCKHCHDFWHTTQKRLGRSIAGRMPTLFLPGQTDGKTVPRV
jgi:hypothetical protein